LAQLNAAVLPYLKGDVTPSLEQLYAVAQSTHCGGSVGGCISKVADRWQDAFPGTRAASVAAVGVKLKLLKPKGHAMVAEGVYPQPPPKCQKHALILRHMILYMFQQKVIAPITPTEAASTLQPPMYHRIWLRPKKADGDGNPAVAIREQNWERLRQILAAWRAIISLNKGVNNYGIAQKFKAGTSRHAIRLIRTGDMLAYVDVKDAFWNVPLHAIYSILCAFWIQDPVLHLLAPNGWKPLTLLFGLWCAPREFVMQLKPCLGLTLQWGMRLSELMDDILMAARSVHQSLQHSMCMLLCLRHFGWVLKMVKLALIPSQIRVYGGWLLSTALRVRVDVPPSKWASQ